MSPELVFTPVRTRRVYEEVAEKIAGAIREGDVRLNERLPSERVLAAQMQVSRPTLREAIRFLVELGIIEVIPGPGGGMFVRSEQVPAALLDERPELRLGEIPAVLEARRLFEPRVAQLAALYATEDDFENLQRSIERQRDCTEDRVRFLQLDHSFHLGIARATKNPTLIAMTRTFLRDLGAAQDLALRRPHEPEWAIGIHQRTLDAIKLGDPDVIENAMDEHLSFLERIWEEESGRMRLRKVPAFLLSKADLEPSPAGRPAAS